MNINHIAMYVNDLEAARDFFVTRQKTLTAQVLFMLPLVWEVRRRSMN